MAAIDTINGNDYRVSGKMDAVTQFHVARKIAPVLAEMEKVGNLIARKDQITTEDALACIGPLTRGLAGLPDADCDYIIAKCLAVVQRKVTDTTWSNVWNKEARAIQFADLDLAGLAQLILMVFREHLASFSRGPIS